MPDQSIQGEFVAIPISTLLSEQWKQFQPTTRCVFWTMLIRKSAENYEIEWSNEELVEATGFSRHTINRAVGELLDEYFIVMAQKGGRWQKTIYEVIPERLESASGIEAFRDLTTELPVGRGIIYFIGNIEAKVVKIGFSRNDVAGRMGAIQTGCPYKLSVLKVIEKTTPVGELMIQNRFVVYKMNGEWFSIDGELAEYLGL